MAWYEIQTRSDVNGLTKWSPATPAKLYQHQGDADAALMELARNDQSFDCARTRVALAGTGGVQPEPLRHAESEMRREHHEFQRRMGQGR